MRAMTTFAKVVETGSFARAAERLDLSVSAVSRQVAELESHLDTRLLHRTTRRLSLTESGRAFHERCVQLLADLEEAEETARSGTALPRGTLRLTCPISFGARFLAPMIAEFMARHPGLRLDVELSDRAVDLVEEGFDLAVRIGAIGSQNLVGRRIGASRLVCCAAPSYLARHPPPERPQELVDHACLTYEYGSARSGWRFVQQDGTELTVRIAGMLHANNGRFLAAMAVAGLGIIYEPDFIVGPYLAAGTLVRLLQGREAPAAAIYVVYPSRRHLSAKVRAFVTFAAERFAAQSWMLDADASAAAVAPA